MSVFLIPTLGPFHLLHPRYNALTVLELIKSLKPQQIGLASYGPQALAQHSWRAAGEASFFHVLPWAESSNVALQALDTDEAQKSAAEEFLEALSQFPKGQALLQQAADLEGSLQAFLTSPKTPQDFADPQTLEPVRAYLQAFVGLFGEGPATGFRLQRMQAVAQHLRQIEASQTTVVLADLLDYAVLWPLLEGVLAPLPPHQPSELQRQRSVLDRAWQLSENDDWAGLLEQLQEVDGPEAMYCAAQIYLAAGQPADAFELLEQLIHSDFQHPPYLPGYTLARYGQLADALGQRDKALRAYQAALALDWLPQEAKEIAQAGQKVPFKLPQ